ncbi:MAG: SbcC/MukB-like Walker B domain-containing protein, partial [Nitrososphaerales archaeon]
VQDRLSQADRDIGTLQQRVYSLDHDVIPELERAGAAAVEAVRGFLLQEEAADMAEEVEKEYARRRERQALEIVLENAGRYEEDHARAEARSRDQLREAKQAYSLRYDFGYDNEEDARRYAAERQRYVESELPEYEARVARQRGLAEQELVENFIHRLREQIEDARSQLDHLNATLSKLRFGGERYEFLASPAPDLRRVYDLVMDSRTVLGGSLFDSDFRRAHQEGWDLLFERLTIGADDERVEELRRLQDYRNYLAYDIRIHYPNGDRALHSQINAKKSGGETTTPFYVAMAASFAQAYRLNQARPSDTIRLAIFDEAFGKMDTARTASALKFMVDTGLQVLLATPPDKAGGLLPYVDSVRTVVRQDNHSFVLEIDKREAMSSD